MDATEEILLDGNALAAGHAFYVIGGKAVSRDGKLLAWADDTMGRNQFSLHVKDLASGTLPPDTATNIAPSMVWANDNKTLFVVGKDANTLREDRVFKEDDGQYYVSVAGTKSHRFIQIAASATTNSEVRLIDADKPATAPKVFLQRSKDHLDQLDHLDGRFVMLTNADAKNFRLVEIAPGKEAARTAWKELISHSPDMLVEDFAVYHGFLAATVRTGGLRKVMVMPTKQPAFFIDAPDPSYAMTVLDTPDAGAKRVRYSYNSMTAPSSVFEADVVTKAKQLLKQQPVPGYDPGGLRQRVSACHGSRRHEGSDLDRLQEGHAPGRHRAPVDVRMARTASRWSRDSTRRWSVCSIEAGCTRWRTSAAVRSWAGPGRRTAS